MKTGKLARASFRMLAVLAVLGAIVVLDWYPTVKELGRLRRLRGDLERKITDYTIMAAKFNFPDQEEISRLTNADAELVRALPLVKNDGAWLRLQEQEIRQSFKVADPWQRYPWHGILPMDPAAGERLASRPLGIALDAPLPELLDFINRVSWGAARLEIVRLRLELTGRLFHAWLVCRGSYRVLEPSAWLVKEDNREGDEKLLIDPDSPLLWQKADPLFAPTVEKRELPPKGSPW